MFDRVSKSVVSSLGVLLCLFTIFEVNYTLLQPQSALAVFVGIGLVICFLVYPVHKRFKDVQPLRGLDVLLALVAGVCCAYVVVQTEDIFKSLWTADSSLANRAGEGVTTLDFSVGLIGLILVIEAARRSIGWAVPLLALAAVAHSYYCYGSQEHDWAMMPDWLFPHAGQNVTNIVETTYLQTSGVFGQAASVMYKYVFLFVVFGAFLEMSGATQFIIDFATKTFGRIRGGPALVSVMASGLMGSLSGSAVANAVTTGTFTIPMMRSARFPKHIAGGITAAAASGGALVPPVMGAGAYMMLELLAESEAKVTFVTIMKAAVIPALLYYLSILAVVFLYSRRLGADAVDAKELAEKKLGRFEAIVFFAALGTLIGLLMLVSPFKSVTGALIVILVCSIFRKQLGIATSARWMAFASFAIILVLHQFTMLIAEPSGWLKPFVAGPWVHPETNSLTVKLTVESLLSSAIVGMFGLLIFGLIHPAWRPEILKAFTKSAKNGVSLVAASACVGIIIGIVQQTGVATDFSASIKGVVETNLFLALLGIMACSLVLGMGVPSVVCYLLMATLMGSLLEELGVHPLAAHMFIFYFGMMSMVTPPVALAGYASASIAEAPIMQTSFAAFRFSLVGFTLPFMFVYRPALCLLAPQGGELTAFAVIHALTAATIGVLALAACLAGYFRSSLGIVGRAAMFVAAALLLVPLTKIQGIDVGLTVDVVGALMFAVVAGINLFISPAAEKLVKDKGSVETTDETN